MTGAVQAKRWRRDLQDEGRGHREGKGQVLHWHLTPYHTLQPSPDSMLPGCVSQPQKVCLYLGKKITKCYFEIPHIRLGVRVASELLDVVKGLWV